MEGGDVTSDSANPLSRLKLNKQTMEEPVVGVQYLMIFFFFFNLRAKKNKRTHSTQVCAINANPRWKIWRREGGVSGSNFDII